VSGHSPVGAPSRFVPSSPGLGCARCGRIWLGSPGTVKPAPLLPRPSLDDEVEIGLVRAIGGLLVVLPEHFGAPPGLEGGVTVGISEIGAPVVGVGRLVAPNGRRSDRREPDLEIAGADAVFLHIDERELTRRRRPGKCEGRAFSCLSGGKSGCPLGRRCAVGSGRPPPQGIPSPGPTFRWPGRQSFAVRWCYWWQAR
jgi:hypothetical protein